VRFVAIRGAKNACEGFRFDEASKTLSIHSVAKEISRIGRLIMQSRGRWQTERIPFNIAPASLQHTLWEDDDHHIGVAVLDEEVVSGGKLCCLRLMWKKRRPLPSPVTITENPAMRYEELILILWQNGEDEHTYERIGVGVLETATPWFENMSPRSFNIR
jgi:hypothetical protein